MNHGKVKLYLVLVIVFCLLLATFISRNSGIAWFTLPFLCYLTAGLLTAPGNVNLRATREPDQVRGDAKTEFTMIVTLENSGDTIPRVHIYEEVQPLISLLDGTLEKDLTLSGGESYKLRYTFRAQRGVYCWSKLYASVSDPFELFEKKIELSAPAEVIVVPDEFPTKQLRLHPRRTLRTAGPYLSRLAGSGVDYYGTREYHTGDSLRWVDWRLSARHPGQFFSKEFEREGMANIGIILDGNAALDLHYGDEALFEYSVKAAAGIARNLIHAGNRVSLITLGEKVIRIFPGSGKTQLVNIFDQLARCQPGGNASLGTLKYLPVEFIPRHSLLILISPLQPGDFQAIANLRAREYQVILVSPDPVQYAHQSGYLPAAAHAAGVERQILLWRIREIGAQVIDWKVDQPLSSVTGVFSSTRE